MGVKEVYRQEKVSKKSGNPYTVLCVVFDNGYKLETFLNNEQKYILADVPVRE